MISRQAVHELAIGIARQSHDVGIDLIRQEELNTFLPHFIGLTHGDPNVRVNEVASLHAFSHIGRSVNFSARFLGDFLAYVVDLVTRLQRLRSNSAEFHPHLSGSHHQGIAHVVTSITQVSERNVL